MTVDERALREVLRARSDQPAVPTVPIDELLSGGRALVRRRHRRLAAVAGIAAALVVVTAGLALQPHHPGSPGPVSPSPTAPADGPRTLGDLPRGDLPRVPFADRSTLYVNGGTVDLEGGDPVLSLGGDGRVVLWTPARDGAPSPIRFVDPETGELSSSVGEATSRPVVSADGRLVAWEDDNADGTARVRLWDVEAAVMLDPVSFPFTPTCCDNPFDLVGIDGEGRVYGTGAGKTWVASEPGGSPALVEGLDFRASESVTAVGVQDLVVMDGSTTRIGHLEGRRFVQDVVEEHSQVTVSWDEQRLAYVDDAATDSTGPADPEEHVWVRGIRSGGPVQMRLPGDVTSANGLLWESDADLLVEVSLGGDPAGKYAWLRCAADTGRCELATTLRREFPSVPLR